MTRIYLIFILFLSAISSAFAQSADLELVAQLLSRNGGQGTYATFNTGDTILADNINTTYLGWVVKNNGPDSLEATDTIIIRNDFTNAVYKYRTADLNTPYNKSLLKDSLINLYFSTVYNPYDPNIYRDSIQKNAPWCDSVWVKRGTSIIHEPDTTNNKICTSLTIWYFLGVDDMLKTASEAFLLYPNPATNNLNMKFDFGANTPANVCVVDMTGKLVYNEDLGLLSGFKDVPLHLTQIPQGIYVVKLTTNKGIFTDRLTIY